MFNILFHRYVCWHLSTVVDNIWKCCGKCSICSIWANAHFPQRFQKYTELIFSFFLDILQFLLIFSLWQSLMSKNTILSQEFKNDTNSFISTSPEYWQKECFCMNANKCRNKISTTDWTTVIILVYMVWTRYWKWKNEISNIKESDVSVNEY